MRKGSRYGSNDRHALLEIAAGTLTADPTTGHVYRNKRIVGSARPDGYIAVNVRRINGKGYVTVTAHRIVWMCHNAPIPVGMIVNHRNGMRWDNRLDNLDLTTATGNQRHARLLDYAAVGSGDDHAVDPQWWAQAKHLIALDAPYEDVAAVTPSAEDDTNQALYRTRPMARPIYTKGHQGPLRTGHPCAPSRTTASPPAAPDSPVNRNQRRSHSPAQARNANPSVHAQARQHRSPWLWLEACRSSSEDEAAR